MTIVPDTDAAIFRQGVVTDVLNPKVGLFLSGTIVNLGVAWTAGSLRSRVESGVGRVWCQRASGAVLVGWGAVALASLSRADP